MLDKILVTYSIILLIYFFICVFVLLTKIGPKFVTLLMKFYEYKKVIEWSGKEVKSGSYEWVSPFLSNIEALERFKKRSLSLYDSFLYVVTHSLILELLSNIGYFLSTDYTLSWYVCLGINIPSCGLLTFLCVVIFVDYSRKDSFIQQILK